MTCNRVLYNICGRARFSKKYGTFRLICCCLKGGIDKRSRIETESLEIRSGSSEGGTAYGRQRAGSQRRRIDGETKR